MAEPKLAAESTTAGPAMSGGMTKDRAWLNTKPKVVAGQTFR